jgi:hypothetical protein
MSLPNPQDPLSPLYEFIDTQPESEYPNNPDSSLSHFTVRQFTPDAISATLPVVVTKTAHGLQNGQGLRATQFISMPYSRASGMEQLNNKLYYVQHATTDTFELANVDTLGVDGRNYTPYISGGQFTVSGPLVVNPSAFPPAGTV